MVAELRPMRLQWWWNPAYWSTQGQVWQEAASDPSSDVGRFFSWNKTIDNRTCDGNTPGPAGLDCPPTVCNGNNPCVKGIGCAQGSWGSTGAFSGVDSALASFGSAEYAAYLVDAMANSWTRNLGIDGYCTDCSGGHNYNPEKPGQCPSGMLQQHGNSQLSLARIIDKARESQPQIAMGGEHWGSWSELIAAHADIGARLEPGVKPGWLGNPTFHAAMKAAAVNASFDGLEELASTSGADAATVLCYLNPAFDGKQPGGCPSMSSRDTTLTMTNVSHYRMWVALEAGSGIMSQHDCEPVGSLPTIVGGKHE
jgi:hypothetical protein